ncbi:MULTISPECIES: hypothetical protein [Streptomyces]|uniref:Uncharacterized protein n=1 Tax=Streptomyces flaveolus TaxID=67297 RepID=A0ABV3ANH0_9ACTN|nr:hypothetical protein [Streptomyces sp. NRRL F-3307]
MPEQAAAAAAAGARLLLVVNDGDGRLQPWENSPWLPADPPPLTVATLTHDEGERLIARTTGDARTRLSVTSHPVTEYVYDLAHDYRGAVPADLVHRTDRRELARVDVSFRNYRAGRALENRDDVTPAGGSALNPSDAPAQGDRTDWVTAGEPWSDRAQIPAEQQQYAPAVTYRAGSAARVSWFGPVQRSRLIDGNGHRSARTTSCTCPSPAGATREPAIWAAATATSTSTTRCGSIRVTGSSVRWAATSSP